MTRDMLKDMKDGSVIVDVAIDQGGCFETSKPTTHAEPTFVIDGVIHYCVANMPGAVARTSTIALTNATLPYALELANKGWKKRFRKIKISKKALTSWRVKSPLRALPKPGTWTTQMSTN